MENQLVIVKASIEVERLGIDMRDREIERVVQRRDRRFGIGGNV